ncbi:MAG: hypothetical protein AAF085_11525 [Planctomycetota bacterium]
MSNPPEQTGNADGSTNDPPIEKQLDALLSKIDAAEPGTLDPDVLPASAQPATPAPQANAEAPDADAEIQAMLNAPEAGSSPEPEIDALLNEPPTEAEIDALLNAPPAESAISEPTPAEPTSAEEPMPAEQAQMLSAMNDALQGVADEPPAQEPSQELSIEEQLQQEIAALMDGEHADTEAETQAMAGGVDLAASVVDEGSTEQAQAASTEDQIAMEIEGLLEVDQTTATATAETPEAAIDQLDQMLAQEIDEDDELAGDFQTVEELTAGIQVDDPGQLAADDEHAATARDVAAELDSQPEDMPPAPQAVPEPVAAAVEAPSKPEDNELFDSEPTDWLGKLEAGKAKLLNACYLINWPARRFLTAEWRANLGYIALLNLFFGVGLWIVLILF